MVLDRGSLFSSWNCDISLRPIYFSKENNFSATVVNVDVDLLKSRHTTLKSEQDNFTTTVVLLIKRLVNHVCDRLPTAGWAVCGYLHLNKYWNAWRQGAPCRTGAAGCTPRLRAPSPLLLLLLRIASACAQPASDVCGVSRQSHGTLHWHESHCESPRAAAAVSSIARTVIGPTAPVARGTLARRTSAQLTARALRLRAAPPTCTGLLIPLIAYTRVYISLIQSRADAPTPLAEPTHRGRGDDVKG